MSEQVSTLAAALLRAENLQMALQHCRTIGMAMGILIERHKVTEDQAFDLLRDASNRTNVKLWKIADQLVRTRVLTADVRQAASRSPAFATSAHVEPRPALDGLRVCEVAPAGIAITHGG
ncbi:protein of unknown function [Modestobacter italicus]|uniref:ANTAR domain-containing protein n=1 Tax=Modestobacter italicus (strain DSM 44449 / CECT 9708 / BC 501) TaxID=2732864 RepID=I4F0D8_MODI5|nr:ANTAR domain-containing protein [Modestobacter marinus]CCH89101.1 protein of unknown function [Modestobacter marinus]